MKYEDVPFVSKREWTWFFIVVACGMIGGAALGFILSLMVL